MHVVVQYGFVTYLLARVTRMLIFFHITRVALAIAVMLAEQVLAQRARVLEGTCADMALVIT